MLDQLTFFDVVVITILGSAVGLFSVQVANDSSKETRKKPLASWVWVFYILINTIFGAVFQWASPWFYAILLVIVALFQAINLEGRKRRVSWNILSALYAVLLILSVVYHRTENKFNPLWLLWLIPIVLPFICGAVSAYRIQNLVDKKNKKEGRVAKTPGVDTIGIAVAWGFIAILAIAIVVLALI